MPELNLVLLGPPGAGKGTQAERLAEDFNLAYIPTGNMLREAVREETELGRKAKEYMERGDLVPDDLIIAMIAERLADPETQHGFLLDGFPRTQGQAEALDDELARVGREVTAALLIDVPEEEAVRRLSGRRVCVKAQHTFNVHSDPPKHPDRCDLDGSRLVVRDDDREEVVRHRIRTYRDKTAPLIDYYEKRGILRRVDGARPPDKVGGQIRAILAALKFEETV
jgi:adenylate kinase